MSRHTAGPWAASRMRALLYVNSDDGENVATVNGKYVGSKVRGKDLHPSEEAFANAQLISAAPDMLDVLYSVRSWIDMKSDVSALLPQIERAIAKAGGRV